VTKDAEKQRDQQRKESRTDKQLQNHYVEQAVQAQREANQNFGFKFRTTDGR